METFNIDYEVCRRTIWLTGVVRKPIKHSSKMIVINDFLSKSCPENIQCSVWFCCTFSSSENDDVIVCTWVYVRRHSFVKKCYMVFVTCNSKCVCLSPSLWMCVCVYVFLSLNSQQFMYTSLLILCFNPKCLTVLHLLITINAVVVVVTFMNNAHQTVL